MLRGLTEYLPELFYTNTDMLEFSLRVIIAGILGCLIGVERSKRNKGAGPRTHAIIACTAAALVLLSKYSFADLADGILGTKGADPARISAAIVSGVSFLGMAVISRQGANVKGLTTAAGIWATATVGMCVGSGFYTVGLVLTVFILILQVILHRFPLHSDSYSMLAISIIMKNTGELQRSFRDLLEEHGGEIEDCDLKQIGIEEISMTMHVRIIQPITFDDAYDFMQLNEGVSRFVV